MRQLHRVLVAALLDPHPVGVGESSIVVRRRRIIVVLTLAVGAVLLSMSLAVSPAGSQAFYWYALALAAVWIVGGLTSGPLHLGRLHLGHIPRRPVLTSVASGVVIAAGFVVGALVTRQIPVLREIGDDVLSHARHGSIVLIVFITVINGIGEEIFFRGALYSAIDRNPVAVSSVVYALATIATLNLLLVFAAAVLGTILGLQRRATGGVLAPVLTHVTWSTILLFALPPLFR